MCTGDCERRWNYCLPTRNYVLYRWAGKNTHKFYKLPWDRAGYGVNQWETTLLCNGVSHWLNSYPEWFLYWRVPDTTFLRHRGGCLLVYIGPSASKKMHLKMLSAKGLSFLSGFNVLNAKKAHQIANSRHNSCVVRHTYVLIHNATSATLNLRRRDDVVSI